MRGSTPSPPRRLTDMIEAGRALALRRWQILRPHLEDGVPLPRAAGAAGVPLRTAQR
jgi:putative transposase